MSRSDFIVMLNNSPEFEFSKNQSSFETNSFRSEFAAMKTCSEYLCGLSLKLRMIIVPTNNSCFIFGDNQSVLWDITIPDSILKKKTVKVSYNFFKRRCVKR